MAPPSDSSKCKLASGCLAGLGPAIIVLLKVVFAVVYVLFLAIISVMILKRGGVHKMVRGYILRLLAVIQAALLHGGLYGLYCVARMAKRRLSGKTR